MTQKNEWRLWWPVVALLCVAGCASIIGIDGEYIEGDPNPSSGGAGGSSNTAGNSTGGTGTGTSSTGGTGTGGTGTGTSSTGGGNTGGATGGNVATAGNGGATGGSPPTGGGGGSPTGLPCNSATCVGGQVCCVSETDQNQSSCETAGNCPQNTFQVECHGPADCPGQICCGRWDSIYIEVKCADTCGSSGPGTGITICSGDPSVCEFYQTCQPSSYLPSGYLYCG